MVPAPDVAGKSPCTNHDASPEMHIGLVCDEYPPEPHGGIGSFTRDLANALVSAGHAVTVVGISRFAKNEVQENQSTLLQIVRLPRSPLMFRYRPAAILDRFRLLRWLSAAHRKYPFDLIECPDYAGWCAFGGPRGVPLLVRLHGSNMFFDSELSRPGDRFEHFMEKRLIARANHLVSPSRYAGVQTLACANLTDRAFTVIPHALDTDLFRPDNSAPTETGLILFVNSINPKKGVEQLLDAMNIVCEEVPAAHLVLIGAEAISSGSPLQYTRSLMERVRPDFRSRITFTGPLDRVHGVLPYLKKAQVCCYPSKMETFGIAPLEAMAVGKPVVYSKKGPGKEVIDDGISGLLCNPDSPADIASKLVRILTDMELAKTLGSNARARVLEQFRMESWLANNIALYEKVVRDV